MSTIPVDYDPACYENIIGLSRNECECLDENTGWDISISGLYVDEAEGMNLRVVEANKDCSNDNNLWLLMDTARNNGIRQFLADTQNQLLQKYQIARPLFHGSIGRLVYKNSLNLTQTYGGVRMSTANVVGAYMKITNINTLFSAAGAFDLNIYNNLNELVAGPIPLQTIAGKKANAVSIILPMWNKNTDCLEYYFTYTVNPANQPKDNDLHCNCGGVRYIFDIASPYYKSKSNKLAGWSKWAMFGSFQKNDLNFFDMSGTTSNYMNGLSFDCQFYCDLKRQYCFDDPNPNDETFISVAFALQHITAYKLLISIITSPNLNRYTMISTDALNASAAYHKSEYENYITWLVKNVPIENTDCLACRGNIKIGVVSL